MLGKADGLRLLDLSADGFWNSFFAIVVALPALIVGWVGIANEIGDPDAFARPPSVMLVGWRRSISAPGCCRLSLLPCVAPRAGIGGRFVALCGGQQLGIGHIAWLMLPSALLRLFVPATDEFAGSCWRCSVPAVAGADLAHDQCRHRQGRGSRHRRFRRHVRARRCWCCTACRSLLGITMPDLVPSLRIIDPDQEKPVGRRDLAAGGAVVCLERRLADRLPSTRLRRRASASRPSSAPDCAGRSAPRRGFR